jgi:hypothetical protein
MASDNRIPKKILIAQYDAKLNHTETQVISENKTQFCLLIDMYRRNTQRRVGTACINGWGVKTQDGVVMQKTATYSFTNGSLFTTLFSGINMSTMSGLYTIPKVTEKIMSGEGNFKEFSGELVVSVVGTNKRIFSIYKHCYE